MKKTFLLVAGYWLLVTILCGCQTKPFYKETRLLMGTFVEVISPDKKAAGIVFTEIKRIENLLSKYIPESEISRLNQNGKLKVSPENILRVKEIEGLLAGFRWSI